MTGSLITGAGDGMATWADVKTQADDLLGIELTDEDVLSVPLLATDPYGRFLAGRTASRRSSRRPVSSRATWPRHARRQPRRHLVPATAVRTGHAFLDDIAHSAVPKAGSTRTPTPS